MSLQLGSITFDCDDTLALAGFWSAVLDRPLDPEPTEFFATDAQGWTAQRPRGLQLPDPGPEPPAPDPGIDIGL